MRNQTPDRGNWMENLENRRLLSGTPNIVGTFTGTFAGSSGSGTLTVQITGQTHRGTLSGTDTTKQRHQSFTFPFTGKIIGDSVTFTNFDGDTTTIMGTVSGRHHQNNVITGTFKGPDGKGTFSVTLVA